MKITNVEFLMLKFGYLPKMLRKFITKKFKKKVI